MFYPAQAGTYLGFTASLFVSSNALPKTLRINVTKKDFVSTFWKFADADEDAFGLYMLEKDKASLRLTSICVFLTAGIFLVIDYHRDTNYQYVLIFRGGLLLVSVLFYWASLRLMLSPDRIQSLIVATLFINFFAYTALGIFGSMPTFYYPNTVPLLLYMGMSIIGIRYRYAVVFNSVLLLLFIGVSHGFSNAYYISQIPNITINFILCTIGGAFIERGKRENFLQYTSLLHQKLQLDELNQQKNKIISILSHDISSPLISLSSLFAMYKSKHITPQELEVFLPEVESRLNKANFLVHNLVRWSKSQMDGFIPEQKIINLNVLIHENLQLAEVQTKDKGIQVNVSTQPMLEVFGDYEMINLIVRNLLSNAVKFSYPNGVIKIQAFCNEKKVLICISNKGVPIEDSVVKKLFSYQIKPQFGTSRERGTGLGLAIAQYFAHINQGRIFYKGDPSDPEMTTFCLELRKS